MPAKTRAQRASARNAYKDTSAANEIGFKSLGTINTQKWKALRPGTSQQEAIGVIQDNPITLLEGVAGTGKTFAAVKAAIDAYDKGLVDKIYISRPPVSQGKDLGALPGTEQQKMDPYLRPIYTMILNDMGRADLLFPNERGDVVVELATLNYLRGCTLNGFVIIDEAQNCESSELYTAITRLGSKPGSRMVLTLDPKQCDLPGGPVGIKQAQEVLKLVSSAKHFTLDPTQNYRNPVVAQFIDAWAEVSTRKQQAAQITVRPRRSFLAKAKTFLTSFAPQP